MPSDESGPGDSPGPAKPFRPLKDANEFRLVAIQLFGTRWKGKVAHAFDVQESTIYRWISEIIPVPHYALSAMAAWKIVFELTGQLPPTVDPTSSLSGPRIMRPKA
jgi:hypothetical protein